MERSFSLLRKNINGFTLIELTIVVLLIILIVGISTVYFAGALPSAKLKSAGREMSAILRHARMLAKTEGEDRSVLVNLTTRRYGIDGMQARSLPTGVNVRIIDPMKGAVSHGEYTFTFDKSGIAEGGTILLSTGQKKIQIDFDPVLGSVFVKPKEDG